MANDTGGTLSFALSSMRSVDVNMTTPQIPDRFCDLTVSQPISNLTFIETHSLP